jgi:hypothetical protein
MSSAGFSLLSCLHVDRAQHAPEHATSYSNARSGKHGLQVSVRALASPTPELLDHRILHLEFLLSVPGHTHASQEAVMYISRIAEGEELRVGGFRVIYGWGLE